MRCEDPFYLRANGYCDDWTNSKECNYDGGDCCGLCVNTEYCIECECLEDVFDIDYSTYKTLLKEALVKYSVVGKDKIPTEEIPNDLFVFCPDLFLSLYFVWLNFLGILSGPYQHDLGFCPVHL